MSNNRRRKKPSNKRVQKAAMRKSQKAASAGPVSATEKKSLEQMEAEEKKIPGVWYPASKQQGLAGDLVNALNTISSLRNVVAGLHDQLAASNKTNAEFQRQLTLLQTDGFLERVGLKNCEMRIDQQGQWVFTPKKAEENVVDLEKDSVEYDEEYDGDEYDDEEEPIPEDPPEVVVEASKEKAKAPQKV